MVSLIALDFFGRLIIMISDRVLSNVINCAFSEGADFCEIYSEESLSSVMELKSSNVDYVSGKDTGVGIRLFYGNEELYTYTNSLDEQSLISSLKSLVSLKKHEAAQKKRKPFVSTFVDEFPTNFKVHLDKEKQFLKKLDRDLRSKSSMISQCHVRLQRVWKTVQVANSEGLLSFDFRPYFRIFISSIAEDQNEKETGYQSVGYTSDIDYLNESLLRSAGVKSVKEALQNLRANHAPAGKFPVIINKGFGGVIFHEACGHGMETTSVAENLSVFSDKMGKAVSTPCVTGL